MYYGKTKVTKDARFRDLEIEDVELQGNEFRLPTEEEIKLYRLEKPKES